MKAITLYQPWAALIAEGVKTIETRPTLHPWRSAVGETIAVHAGRPATKADHEDPIWEHVASDGLILDRFRPLAFSAIVATCRLVDVVNITWRGYVTRIDERTRCLTYDDGGTAPLTLHRGSESRDVSDQLPFGVFHHGRYALVLDNIEKLPEPIPARGFQGLWNCAFQGSESVHGPS